MVTVEKMAQLDQMEITAHVEFQDFLDNQVL